MYKLCKTEQSAQRQRQLEEGLLRVMECTSYDEISVSDLCQQMGIPRKSFYRYFASKDGALHALIDHTLMEFENFNEIYKLGERRTLQRDLEKFFLFWVHRKPLLDAIQRSSLGGILIERAINYALTDAVFPGKFLQDETRQMQNYVVMFSVCGLMSMMLQWHHESYQEDISEMPDPPCGYLPYRKIPCASELP